MTYTQLGVVAVAVMIVADLWLLRVRLLRRKAFWASYVIIVFFQLVTNAMFTGSGIVLYDDSAIVGSSSPVEGAPPFLGDGRIAFGAAAISPSFSPRIGPAYDYDEGAMRIVTANLHRMFPSFRDVPIAAGWGGPIDISSLYIPYFGTLPGGNVHYGFGYTGNGVGPSHVGGNILAELALHEEGLYARLAIAKPLNAITTQANNAAQSSATSHPGPPISARVMPINAAAEVTASAQ